MSANSMIDWFLLESYLTGVCTSDERVIVERWIALDPGHPDIVRRVREALESRTRGDTRDWDRAAAIDTVLTHVREDLSSAVTPPATAPRSYGRLAGGMHRGRGRAMARWTGVLVTAAVCGVIAVLWHSRNTIAAYGQPRYVTGAGEIRGITLTDGSHVTLAPNTNMTVTEFGARGREVSVSGEAYFDVVERPTAPFVVHTGQVSTRVLGTRFDVRSDPVGGGLQVAVVTGRVAVSSPRGRIVLSAGMVAQLTDSTPTVVRTNDAVAETEWTQGTLRFRDVPVEKILAELGRWYAVDMRVPDTVLARRLVTGTFAGDNLSVALATLEDVLHIGITYDSSPGKSPIITLTTRTSRQSAPPRLQERQDLIHHPLEVGR